MAAAAILKVTFFGHNSSTDCPISAKFCTRKIKDGGRPPFLKSLNHHISVKNRLILMKFGTLQQILNPMTVTWPKIEIFKIQDGGGRHLENRLFGFISSTDCLIAARYCGRKQNGMPTKASSSKGQGLFSPVGQDRQWVHRPSPERVLLVKLGTKHLALC